MSNVAFKFLQLCVLPSHMKKGVTESLPQPFFLCQLLYFNVLSAFKSLVSYGKQFSFYGEFPSYSNFTACTYIGVPANSGTF